MVKIQCKNIIDQQVTWEGDAAAGVSRAVLSDPSLALEITEPCLSAVLHKFVGLPYTGGTTVVYPQPWSAFILRNWNHAK
jgi:hypothetical protein